MRVFPVRSIEKKSDTPNLTVMGLRNWSIFRRADSKSTPGVLKSETGRF